MNVIKYTGLNESEVELFIESNELEFVSVFKQEGEVCDDGDYYKAPCFIISDKLGECLIVPQRYWDLIHSCYANGL